MIMMDPDSPPRYIYQGYPIKGSVPISSATEARQRLLACEPFPFQRLPVEIRIMIYDLAFVSPNPIRVHHPHIREEELSRFRERRAPPRHILPRGTMEMLLLSKTISAEIRHVLYTKNTFYLTAQYHRPWLCTIGLPNARCLRSLAVFCGDVNNDSMETTGPALAAFQNTLLKRVPSLTSIRFVFGYNAPNGPRHWQPVFPGVEKLLELSVPWTRWPFLREITILTSCPAHAETLLPSEPAVIQTLANSARTTVRCGVARAYPRSYKGWVQWLVEREPEEPKPVTARPAYPDVVMSSAARHAVWKKKMETKQARRIRKELLRPEEDWVRKCPIEKPRE
ncbi:hypothetical protein QBC39DRAFT_161929 [Podospora conica]|nr:hypothetical protein QBC39DRAFT_161929 [Schizothecium conicum]